MQQRHDTGMMLSQASLLTTQRYLEHLSHEDLADLAPNISAYERVADDLPPA